MKIEINKLEQATIEEFADKHDLTMIVRERNKHTLGDRWSESLRYSAHFKDADIKESSVLIGGYGNGATAEQAIADYACRISGRKLVIKAMSNDRRDIDVPIIVS